MNLCFFFLFKQKTAYEMRISDWSSDVCSSDLLDLRMNGGGSSDWSYQMAKVLWGDASTAAAPAGSRYAEWRVSQDNLDHLQTTYDRRKQGGALSPEVDRYIRAAIEGIGGALASGKELWREGGDDETRLTSEERAQIGKAHE